MFATCTFSLQCSASAFSNSSRSRTHPRQLHFSPLLLVQATVMVLVQKLKGFLSTHLQANHFTNFKFLNIILYYIILHILLYIIS